MVKKCISVIALAGAMLLAARSSLAQSCHWNGTAPFCDGACGTGETEHFRDNIDDSNVQILPSQNLFGDSCATGTKAYCCKTPGVTCRWDGTAPFCDGACQSFEKQTAPPAGSSSGHSCWSGSKVFCCSPQATGSSSQALTDVTHQAQASEKYARFAAIWEKSSGPTQIAQHGMTSAQYQEQVVLRSKQGYRLVSVNGYDIGGLDRYVAIWEKSPGPAQEARHAMTSSQYNEAVGTLSKRGYRLVHVSGYDIGGVDRYAAIWEKSGGPVQQARHGMTTKDFEANQKSMMKLGYRLVKVSGYDIGGQDHYAAIWEKSVGAIQSEGHGMTSDQYQVRINQMTQQGYRLIGINGWGIAGQDHYAAIWEKSPGPVRVARHRLLSDSYQDEVNAMSKDYRLMNVSGYHLYGD